MRKTVITLFFGITFFSCNTEATIQDKDLYSINSKTLINQILSTEFRDCDCIVEPRNESFIEKMKNEKPHYAYKNLLLEKLNISNESTLDSLLNRSHKFQINNILKNRKIKIISQNELESIMHNNDKSNSYKILDEMCPKGISVISKPLFNKNFQIALIDIQDFYGGCIPYEPYVCELKNGKWEFKFFYSD